MLRVYLVQCAQHFLHVLFPDPPDLHTFLTYSTEQLAKHLHTQHLNNIHTLFIYSDPPIRAAIKSLKYQNRNIVAKRFAPLLAEHITKLSVSKKQSYTLLPIPASPRRKKVYGFNQCDTLCAALIPYLPKHIECRTDLLTRTHGVVSQTKLTKKERVKNISHAFVASPHLTGTDILIIDDVYTTGATLTAAIHACAKAQAASVTALAIAYQPKKHTLEQ